jgi:hypothetical protein
MDEALHCRVVEVEVALKGSEKFSYSNGFAIDNERILTSAHGIAGAQAIRIRFLEVPGAERIEVAVPWDGYKRPDKWDVAVLQVKDPAQVPVVVQNAARPWLPLRKIVDKEDWNSRGSIRARVVQNRDGTKTPTIDDFGGETFGSTKEGVVTLTVPSHPKNPEGWRGASGSPVMNRRELLAVVRSYPEAWDGSRLRATALHPLRDDTEFLNALGLTEVFRRIDALAGKVATLLEPYPDLIERLATRFVINANQAMPIAEALCSLSGLDLLSSCNRIQDAYIGESAPSPSRDDCKASEALEKVVLLLVPRLLGTAEALRQAMRGNASALLPLRWVTKTVIELEMAALDERQAEFEKENPVGREPKGKYLLPDSPEMGSGKNALAKAVAAVVKDLANKILSPSILQTTPPSEHAQQVNATLKTSAEDALPGRYLYFIANRTWKSDFTAALAAAIPNLKVCCLGSAQNQQERELDQRLVNLVVRFLTLKQRREQLCPATG